MRERCERAATAADSAELFRVVGTGGSLAGNCGVTVRGGVVVVAGFTAVAVVVVVAGFAALDVVVVAPEDAGFAAELEVLVVAAALGVVAYAAQMRDEEKLQCCIRCGSCAALGEEAVRRADMPLRARIAAIMRV